MAMGQQKDRQGDLMVSWSEMPRSPGHVFYDRLQLVLIEGGFDGFAEAVCQPYYAARMGAPSVPPGRYFRMHLVGYFEGIDSERGLEWRCSDSLSLREFLLLEMRERVPDHSWLSRTRARLPHEVHTAVFDWVLALIAEAGLVKGERIGVDASTMEANAALRNIVRRDTGEGYRGMLERQTQQIAHVIDAFACALSGELVVLAHEGGQLQGLKVVVQQHPRLGARGQAPRWIAHASALDSRLMYDPAAVVATRALGRYG